MENKKIKNAKEIVYDGYLFKSLLEKTVYVTLIQQGIKPLYEGITFELSPSLRPTKPFYCRTSNTPFHYKMDSLSKITYTPDFTFTYNDIFVIIEVKGFANDTYAIKKNLFRKYLESYKTPVMFFEVKSKGELLQALNILKEETDTICNIRELIPRMPSNRIAACNKALERHDYFALKGIVSTVIKHINKDSYIGPNTDAIRELYRYVTNIIESDENII